MLWSQAPPGMSPMNVPPSIPRSSSSLWPCQGALGAMGVSYRSLCPGCDPAQGWGTWQGGPRSSSPRQSCAGGGLRGCSSRTCPAQSHRTLGGKGGGCDAPSTAGTRWPVQPGGRWGIWGGGEAPSPLPTTPSFGPGQAQGRSRVPSGHGRAMMDGTDCPHPHGCVPSWGVLSPSVWSMVPPRHRLSPGSGQAPSDTCRSSRAMYPWLPPAPTASNIACRRWAGWHTEVGSCHAPLISHSLSPSWQRGPRHPAPSHLPVPIRPDGDVAAMPGVPLHGAYAHHLSPHPALLHKDPKEACPRHPPWSRDPGPCYAGMPPASGGAAMGLREDRGAHLGSWRSAGTRRPGTGQAQRAGRAGR